MSKQTLKNQVEFILTTIPATRNSDITLTIELWKYYYKASILERNGEYYIGLKQLFDLPREDNIKRIRAQIQNEDRRLLPTDLNILIERARASKEWKDFLGYATFMGNDKLEELIKEWLASQSGQQSLL